MDWSAIYMRDVFAVGPVPRRARGGGLRLLAGDDALLRRQLRRPAFAEHGGAGAPLRDDGRACSWCSSRPRRWSRSSASRCSASGPSAIFPLAISAAAQRTDRAGGDQRRGAGADLLHHLPARPAAARLRRPALGHPLGLRHRAAAGRGQPRARGLARAASAGLANRKESPHDPPRRVALGDLRPRAAAAGRPRALSTSRFLGIGDGTSRPSAGAAGTASSAVTAASGEPAAAGSSGPARCRLIALRLRPTECRAARRLTPEHDQAAPDCAIRAPGSVALLVPRTSLGTRPRRSRIVDRRRLRDQREGGRPGRALAVDQRRDRRGGWRRR